MCSITLGATESVRQHAMEDTHDSLCLAPAALMRVERVRYFEAAARLGSLRAAAEEVGISQQSLGQQIELLEEELDTVLLTRTRRGVTPTTAGESLRSAARALIGAEDGLRDAAMTLRGDYQGSVRLGCVPVLATALVGPVVARLLKGHPGLKFSVVESSSREIEERVAEGQLDLGVVTQPVTPAPTHTQRHVLFTVPLMVCLSPSHPLAARESVDWDDLRGRPLVSMRTGTTLWDTLHRHLEDPQVVFEAATVSTVRRMVAQGVGIGIEAQIDLDGGAAESPVARVPLVGPDTTIAVCLTHNTGTQPSRAAVTVRNVIITETTRLRGEVTPPSPTTE